MLGITKNVPAVERGIRLAAGCALIAGGMLAMHASPIGIGIAVVGAVLAVTAVVGFCPMCCVMGRCPLK